MPDSLILVLLALLGALVILGVGLLAFRRFGEQSAIFPPMPAAYRAAGPAGDAAGQWRRGTLRFDEDRLTLKGSGGLSAGPWLRGNLDLGIASPADAEDSRQIAREGLIKVPVTYGTSSFELALDEEHYTALRAWVEAVPPGWNASIA